MEHSSRGGFHAIPASVSKTCLIRFDRNRYSVDARAPSRGLQANRCRATVGRPVEIRAYADRLECWPPLAVCKQTAAGQRDGQVVARHERVFGSGKTVYDPLHYLPVLARKPGALRNGAPFKEWDLPPALRRVQRKLERQPGGDRQVVEILGAILIDGIDAVEAACVEALSHNVHSAGVVLNILARHREPPPPLNIATPDALKLTCEPAATSRRLHANACRPANCDRYDSLRGTQNGTITSAGRVTPKACVHVLARLWRDGPVEALRHEDGLRRDHRHGPLGGCLHSPAGNGSNVSTNHNTLSAARQRMLACARGAIC